MNPHIKSIAATAAGLLTAFVLIMIVESVSVVINPMPPGIDTSDRAQMEEFVKHMPLSGFWLVLAAWSLGSFAGAAVARRLAPQRRMLPGLIVCGLLLIATMAILLMIPHPMWFSITGIAAVVVFGWVGLAITAGPLVVQTTREIKAPLETVFKTIATISEFSQAVPGILKIEFLTDQHYGVGTRFRETRSMNGKEVATELEVTELVENQRIRMVSDAGGTIWDTVFTTEQRGEHVLMTMLMDARPYQIPSKLMTPMILGMVSKAVEADMDCIKHYCESGSSF